MAAEDSEASTLSQRATGEGGASQRPLPRRAVCDHPELHRKGEEEGVRGSDRELEVGETGERQLEGERGREGPNHMFSSSSYSFFLFFFNF